MVFRVYGFRFSLLNMLQRICFFHQDQPAVAVARTLWSLISVANDFIFGMYNIFCISVGPHHYLSQLEFLQKSHSAAHSIARSNAQILQWISEAPVHPKVSHSIRSAIKCRFASWTTCPTP